MICVCNKFVTKGNIIYSLITGDYVPHPAKRNYDLLGGNQMNTKISPSLLSADLTNIRSQLKTLEDAGADWLHLDVMDGHFVPNITFGPMVIKQLRPLTSIPFDTHLMIERPERYIDAFIDAGADIITIHVESTVHVQRALSSISERGIKTGLALNPSTSLDALDWVADDIDIVLLMSVNPGFGGQSFIPAILEKIDRTRQKLDELGCSAEIEVDGGIKDTNAGAVARAGADILVAGSFTFKANGGDIKGNLQKLRDSVH